MRRHRLSRTLAGLLVLCALVAPHTRAQAALYPATAQAVVTTYLQALNDGMRQGDVSTVPPLYAPDATVTFSTADGVTKVFRGRAAITRFYRHLLQMIPGFQWRQDHLRTLSPTVVLSYEHPVTPGQVVVGRCAHLFVLQDGQIESLDWVVYH